MRDPYLADYPLPVGTVVAVGPPGGRRQPDLAVFQTVRPAGSQVEAVGVVVAVEEAREQITEQVAVWAEQMYQRRDGQPDWKHIAMPKVDADRLIRWLTSPGVRLGLPDGVRLRRDEVAPPGAKVVVVDVPALGEYEPTGRVEVQYLGRCLVLTDGKVAPGDRVVVNPDAPGTVHAPGITGGWRVLSLIDGMAEVLIYPDGWR